MIKLPRIGSMRFARRVPEGADGPADPPPRPRISVPTSCGVDLVAIWHDRIMVAASPSVDLRLGETSFRPLARPFDVNLIADPGFARATPPWRSFDDGTKTGRDMLPALQIANGHTGYIRLDCARRGRLEPGIVKYVDPTMGAELPLHGASQVRWSALIAAQKSVFQMRLEFRDRGGRLLEQSGAVAPSTATGGRNPLAYARVGGAVDVPADAHTVMMLGELTPLAGADIAVGLFTDVTLALSDPGAEHQMLADSAMPLAALSAIVSRDDRALLAAPIVPPPPGGAPIDLTLHINGTAQVIGTLGDQSGTADITVGSGEISVAPKQVQGRLALRADGRWVDHIYGAPSMPDLVHTIRTPHHLLDGRRHTFDLVSASGCHASIEAAQQPVSTPWAQVAQDVQAPLPGENAPLAAHRYRAFVGWAGRAMPHAEPAWAQTHLKALHDTLVLGVSTKDVFPLQFPDVENPVASIIVAGHPSERLTFLTLASLAFAPVETSFEIILASASVDDAPVSGAVRVCPVPADAAFDFSAVSQEARGDVIVHLAPGTEVTAGWLDGLVNALGSARCAIAGPKRLGADGRLWDAGGQFSPQLDAQPVGRGGNPFDPRFCYRRSVDFVPSGAFAIRAELLRDAGEAFCGVEHQSLDLAMTVSERGMHAVYAADVVVIVHAEPAGVAIEGSLPTFQRRWSTRRPPPLSPRLAFDRHVTARVLFALADIPRSDADAGSVAALEEIAMMQALGAKVTLVTRTMAHLPRYADALARMGVELIHAPFYPTMAAFVAERGDEFDAVFATKFQVLEDILPAVRRSAPQAKVMLNLADLHFLREFRALAPKGNAADPAAADAVRTRELAAIRAADVVCTYSSVEASVILSHTGAGIATAQLPWVQRTRAEAAPFADRAGLCFLGNYRHAPNVEAVEWFDQSVMPRLAVALPGVTFHAYGAASDVLSACAHAIVEGYAANLNAMFDRHRICVVPLRSGAGVKGKVFQALAAGCPVVCTSIAAEGIEIRDGEHALIADDAGSFADSVARLYNDEALSQHLTANAKRLIEERYGFAAGTRAMQAAFEVAGIFLPIDELRVTAAEREPAPGLLS